MTARSARMLSYAAVAAAVILLAAALGPWSPSMGAVAVAFIASIIVALVLFWHSTALQRLEHAERNAGNLAKVIELVDLVVPRSRACDHALLNANEEADRKAVGEGDPAFEGDGVELVPDGGRLRRVISGRGTGMPIPGQGGGGGSPRRADEPPEGLPQLADLREGLSEFVSNQPQKPPAQLQETVYASPWQMHLLRDQTLLNLGHYGEMDLITQVPGDFEPTLDRETMLQAYLGPWLDAQTLSFEDAEANVKSWRHGEPEGLFWTGEGGYVLRAWLWAIVTTHSFAPLVHDITDATRYDPDDYREQMEQGKLSLLFILGVGKPGYIEHNADGRILSHDPGHEALAWTYFGQIRVRANTRVFPQLADYYMWWAWRLYAWAREGDGGYLEELMGLCCARAAMAEITQMATLIVHEVGHLKGSSYHCHSGVGFFDCSQYLMEWTFLHRTLAALGLPIPHHHNFGGDVGPVSGTDFRFSEVNIGGAVMPKIVSHAGSSEFSGFGEFQEAWAAEKDCRSATFLATHEWVLTAGRPVTVIYHVPWHCSKVTSVQDGTITYS